MYKPVVKALVLTAIKVTTVVLEGNGVIEAGKVSNKVGIWGSLGRIHNTQQHHHNQYTPTCPYTHHPY